MSQCTLRASYCTSEGFLSIYLMQLSTTTDWLWQQLQLLANRNYVAVSVNHPTFFFLSPPKGSLGSPETLESVLSAIPVNTNTGCIATV